MKENLKVWNNLKAVPAEAKKRIAAGRLKGMTDIKPQWRLKMMTEQFGVIGLGWYYEISKTWTESYGSEISAHVMVNLYIMDHDNKRWSAPIQGIGGSMLIANEKIKDYEKTLYNTPFKPYHSDEAYKMATTDALSVAMKQIGVAADVYMGLSDSKYDKKESDASSNDRPIDISFVTVQQKGKMKDFLKKFTENNDSKAIDYISEALANKLLTEAEAATIIKHAKTKLGEI